MATARRDAHAANKESLAKYLIFFSIFILSADLIYKSIYGITYSNRQDCVLYASLPRWGFLIYEYLVELGLVVLVGVFAAALLEKRFSRLRRFVPRNPITAFLYASIIPVCSCTAIPLIKAMKDRVPVRVMISFVVAAPLLNPYIIVLSMMVLGLQYAILRIACSLILAVSTGIIVELYLRSAAERGVDPPSLCSGGACHVMKGSVYESAFSVFGEVFPYLLAAGILGIAVELLAPANLLKNCDFNGNIPRTILVMLAGVPIYLCNGADVLFLQPFMLHGQLPMGTAMAFSLTSTSVCVTSLVLLAKFLGWRPTLVILSCVVSITLLLSLAIQLIPLPGS